jgi:hypothetical protein
MNVTLEPKLAKWLSVDEAVFYCQQNDLSRTKKTIRQWCRQEHVEAMKQMTPHGEKWMLDRASLELKVEVELEFSAIRQSADHVRPHDEPVQTSANQSEPVRTGSNLYEPDDIADHLKEINSLKEKLQSLQIDKGVRDKFIHWLQVENSKGRETQNAQARYIGHLETIAIDSGASPDSQYLAAPVPVDEVAGIEGNASDSDIHSFG